MLTYFHRKILSEICTSQKHLHYRSSIKEFYNFFASVCIDIDFSENFTLPVKHQAQSLHWSYTKVTVHTRIIKVDGEKIYHVHQKTLTRSNVCEDCIA